MEIPEMNMISNFEAGVNCLQNPSLISRVFSFSGVGNVFQVYSFCKWGALIFAIFATFSSLVRRIKLVFVNLRSIAIKQSLIESKEVDFSDEDDEILSGSSDEEWEEEEEEEEEESWPTTSLAGRDVDFCLKGSGKWVHRWGRSGGGVERFEFDWSDFASSKSVVKLWDSLSSSFNFGEAFGGLNFDGVVSRWDSDEYRRFPLPTVVLTAEGNANGNGVVLRGYDSRVRRRVPALYGEWKSPLGSPRIAAAGDGGGGKVFARGNGEVTVGDVRNVKVPLEKGGASDGETWWDADAVIVDDEFVLVDKLGFCN